MRISDWSSDVCSSDLKPAVHRSGVHPATRFHDLRHTAAALMIAAGADIKVLQRMLGHSSAVLTLDRYGHLFPGQAESVADRLDEMAEAAGVVQRAEVVAIDRGRSGSEEHTSELQSLMRISYAVFWL